MSRCTDSVGGMGLTGRRRICTHTERDGWEDVCCEASAVRMEKGGYLGDGFSRFALFVVECTFEGIISMK